MCRFKLDLILKNLCLVRFNTSYVSVQEDEHTLKTANFTVSIHPMCRFKLFYWLLAGFLKVGFNTSYVSVQVMEKITLTQAECFNTSYVSVQGALYIF